MLFCYYNIAWRLQIHAVAVPYISGLIDKIITVQSYSIMVICWETVFTKVKGQPQYPYIKETSSCALQQLVTNPDSVYNVS